MPDRPHTGLCPHSVSNSECHRTVDLLAGSPSTSHSRTQPCSPAGPLSVFVSAPKQQKHTSPARMWKQSKQTHPRDCWVPLSMGGIQLAWGKKPCFFQIYVQLFYKLCISINQRSEMWKAFYERSLHVLHLHCHLDVYIYYDPKAWCQEVSVLHVNCRLVSVCPTSSLVSAGTDSTDLQRRSSDEWEIVKFSDIWIIAIVSTLFSVLNHHQHWWTVKVQTGDKIRLRCLCLQIVCRCVKHIKKKHVSKSSLSTITQTGIILPHYIAAQTPSLPRWMCIWEFHSAKTTGAGLQGLPEHDVMVSHALSQGQWRVCVPCNEETGLNAWPPQRGKLKAELGQLGSRVWGSLQGEG